MFVPDYKYNAQSRAAAQELLKCEIDEVMIDFAKYFNDCYEHSKYPPEFTIAHNGNNVRLLLLCLNVSDSEFIVTVEYIGTYTLSHTDGYGCIFRTPYTYWVDAEADTDTIVAKLKEILKEISTK